MAVCFQSLYEKNLLFGGNSSENRIFLRGKDELLVGYGFTGKKFVGGIIARGTKPTEFTNCVSVSDVTVQIQDNAGILAGNVAAGGTVTGTSVGGSFNGTALDATNFTGYCFGTASPFKDTANISFAE
jgi:hypothetical protein